MVTFRRAAKHSLIKAVGFMRSVDREVRLECLQSGTVRRLLDAHVGVRPAQEGKGQGLSATSVARGHRRPHRRLLVIINSYI